MNLWVVMIDDYPMSIHTERIPALQWCLLYLKYRDGDRIDEALDGMYQVEQPINWNCPAVIDAIDDLCQERHCTLIETRFIK